MCGLKGCLIQVGCLCVVASRSVHRKKKLEKISARQSRKKTELKSLVAAMDRKDGPDLVIARSITKGDFIEILHQQGRPLGAVLEPFGAEPGIVWNTKKGHKAIRLMGYRTDQQRLENDDSVSAAFGRNDFGSWKGNLTELLKPGRIATLLKNEGRGNSWKPGELDRMNPVFLRFGAHFETTRRKNSRRSASPKGRGTVN